MKSLYVFLLMALVASAGFAQVGVGNPATVSVACPEDACHVTPVFMGEGGFVGTADDGVDMVKFVVECGMGTMRGSAEPDSNGIVRQLFTMANGLACNEEGGGTLSIEGLMDGGWYWINDDVNSAVAPLVAKNTLDNMKTTPIDPGGVTLTATDHGTFVKHEASGRVGIISHILPMPEVEAEMTDACGPTYSGGKYVAKKTNCKLGNGKTMIALTGPASGGRMARITNGMVTRPADEDDTVTVTFALWGNGSGHVSDTALKGWDMTPRSPHKAMSFPADFKVNILGLPGVSLTEAGIELKNSDVTVTTKKRAAAVAEDADTARLENGPWNPATPMNKRLFGTPPGPTEGNCKQAVDADGTSPLWQAADGGDPIKTSDGPTYNANGSTYIVNMENWVESYNDSNERAIRMARFGNYARLEDGILKGFNDVVYDVPLVVCDMVDETTTYNGSIDISSPSDLCKAGNRTTAKLQVYAPLAAAKGKNADVVPPLVEGGKVGTTSAAAIARLDVMCAPASANRGQELVPGNPFPVSDE